LAQRSGRAGARVV